MSVAAPRTILGLFVVASLLLGGTSAHAAGSPNLVISQVYGGGGNSGADYTHDYIEIFNRGTTTASITGWSLQYTSATGTGNFGSSSSLITEFLSGSLAPGQYFLVQEASGGGGTTPLPTPDLVDATPINMAATGGKVALVNTMTPLGCNGGSTPCGAAALATIVDLIGYGGADFFEGVGSAPALTNTTAAFRASQGCTDTDNNAADFAAAAPTPRNSLAALHSCATAVTVASANAARTARGVRVHWRTVTEADLLGFHVYRSRGHSWQRLTRSLIVAKGSVSGASYSFLDRTTRRGISYRYRIKAVNRDRTTAWFGP